MTNNKIFELLEQMTLEEKVDQLLQLAAAFYSDKAEEKTGPMSDLGLSQETINLAGTTLGVSGAKEAIRVQKEYMAKNRLHIPTILMADIIHGFRTIFPIPLALGCTWDEDAVEEMAAISAREAAVSGLHVTFSPMVDLVRDPRWGRVMESTGEDAYLNSRLAQALVKGYQGDDLKNDFSRIAACVKHFAAYGAAIGGRDYNSVDLSEQQLREQYLPGYKAAIDAGAKLVMTSFNALNGVPATGNKWLFRDILRKEFDFDGVVISDWGAIQELIAHGAAKDKKQAAKLAIEAGVDIEMMTTCYTEYLEELINEGVIKPQLLDEAVLRILQLKEDLGLFENPYRGADEEKEAIVVFSKEHQLAAKNIAKKAIVLLKNEEAILPIKREETVAIVGPCANSHDILGAWSWQGKQSETITLVEGASTLSSSILFGQEPFDYFAPSDAAIEEAVSLAKKADKVVLSLGETSEMSGEAASRSSIRLPEEQIRLFHEIKKYNSEIIVTIFNGRPLDLSDIDSAKAIVEAWFPGSQGGNALAEILWGVSNPSGRLSMSFPESVGQVPIYYNVENTGRPYEAAPDEKYVSKYLDCSNYAKYPFGFGLSYGHVTYSEFTTSSILSEEEPLNASVIIKNTSSFPVEETVQVYVRDLVGERVRPLKELKSFEKVHLEPGEEKKMLIRITESQLRYVHIDNQWRSDEGEFQLMVGPNSRDLLTSTFQLTR